MPMSRILKLAAVAAIVAAVPAYAYEIGSGIPIPQKYHNLHETFTRVAGVCAHTTRSIRPRDCAPHFKDALRQTRRRQADPENTDSYASRWSDDPMRMLDGALRAKAGYGRQFQSCKKVFGSQEAANLAIDEAGLLCSSHFGRLQFLHAQSRPQDREDSAPKDYRDPSITRNNILAWADFAYHAAANRTFRQSSYCDGVSAIQEERVRAALTFADAARCRDRTAPGKDGPERYLGWQVGTLFGQRCTYLWTEGFCWDQTEPVDDAMAEYGARGAILHLIQDSYSQSHAARLAPNERDPGPLGPFSPRVVCMAPVAYYDYSQQNKQHAHADVPPVLHSSCLDPDSRIVDDVITASAVALYFLDLDEPDPVGFHNYLATRVFPLAR